MSAQRRCRAVATMALSAGSRMASSETESSKTAKRICLNLKVRGRFELFGPATKRHVQANNFSFYESVDFFQNDNRHDDGVFALFPLLQDSARAVSQAPPTVRRPENQRVRIGNVNHLNAALTPWMDCSLSFLRSWGFDKVHERQVRAKVAGDLNYRPKESWTRIDRQSSSRNPRSQP
jgi:hypothetical protein